MPQAIVAVPLVAYRDGRATLAEVFKEQRRHMPAWNDLMPFLAKHGLSVDRLAMINVAWCATAGDDVRDIHKLSRSNSGRRYVQ